MDVDEKDIKKIYDFRESKNRWGKRWVDSARDSVTEANTSGTAPKNRQRKQRPTPQKNILLEKSTVRKRKYSFLFSRVREHLKSKKYFFRSSSRKKNNLMNILGHDKYT